MEPTTASPVAEDGPPRGRRGPVLLIAIVSLLVGVIVGGLIGWQVEKRRVEDDAANVRPVGTITAVTADSLTMHLASGGGNREYKLTDATAIESAEATTRKLADGATVLVRGRRSKGDLEAVEVIVLPAKASSDG